MYKGLIDAEPIIVARAAGNRPAGTFDSFAPGVDIFRDQGEDHTGSLSRVLTLAHTDIRATGYMPYQTRSLIECQLKTEHIRVEDRGATQIRRRQERDLGIDVHDASVQF